MLVTVVGFSFFNRRVATILQCNADSSPAFSTGLKVTVTYTVFVSLRLKTLGDKSRETKIRRPRWAVCVLVRSLSSNPAPLIAPSAFSVCFRKSYNSIIFTLLFSFTLSFERIDLIFVKYVTCPACMFVEAVEHLHQEQQHSLSFFCCPGLKRVFLISVLDWKSSAGL